MHVLFSNIHEEFYSEIETIDTINNLNNNVDINTHLLLAKFCSEWSTPTWMAKHKKANNCIDQYPLHRSHQLVVKMYTALDRLVVLPRISC